MMENYREGIAPRLFLGIQVLDLLDTMKKDGDTRLGYRKTLAKYRSTNEW